MNIHIHKLHNNTNARNDINTNTFVLIVDEHYVNISPGTILIQVSIRINKRIHVDIDICNSFGFDIRKRLKLRLAHVHSYGV